MMVMVELGVRASSQVVWSVPLFREAIEEPAQIFVCRILEAYWSVHWAQ